MDQSCGAVLAKQRRFDHGDGCFQVGLLVEGPIEELLLGCPEHGVGIRS